MTRYHCYRWDENDFVSHDVTANSASEAAAMAAAASKTEGDWTVVNGQPVTVHVKSEITYRGEILPEAARADP